MKIDFHVHLTPPELIASWRTTCANEPYWKLLAGSPKNKMADADTLVAELDKTGFDAAVAFGFSFTDMGLCRMVNDYTMEAQRRFPGRIIGFMSVVPGAPGMEKEMLRCHAGGLHGVGELFPAGQPFQLTDAKTTDGFARVCETLRLPLILHANEPVGHYYEGKTNTRLPEFESFIERYPHLTVVLAHWGGGMCFYELMPEMKEKLRNVYYDNAASIFLYGSEIYRVAEAHGLTDKLLFGSDYPLVSPARYRPGMEESGMSEQAIQKMLGGNAERILRESGALL